MARLTIEDYQKMYAQARATGDAAGMQAANDGANAIRVTQGEAAQYATADIAKVAAQSTGSTGYVTQNTAVNTAADQAGALSAAYQAQQRYVAENPTATQPLTDTEKQIKYSGALANAAEKGAAAEGTSGADERLLSDGDYAIVQQLKAQFAAAQQQYNAAVAAGNMSAASAAQQAMDSAHLEAERVRSGYQYSGGSDGSLYLSYPLIGSQNSGADRAAGSTGAVEDYSDYLRQLYAAKQASAVAQLQAAYESSLAELDQAGAGVAQAYQQARNSTAGASELARRNFAEYAAASGLSSGTGGQAELARGVTLQNDLNSIDTAEANTVAQLELQRANAESQYTSAIAQAQATGDYELASALYQEKVRVQKALIEQELEQQQMQLKQYQLAYQAQRDEVSDQQTADQLAFQQQKYADSLAQSQQDSATQQAQSQTAALAEYGFAFLKQGVMPSDAMLAAMGITQADARAYIEKLAQQ
jgi:hypothetical protein